MCYDSILQVLFSVAPVASATIAQYLAAVNLDYKQSLLRLLQPSSPSHYERRLNIKTLVRLLWVCRRCGEKSPMRAWHGEMRYTKLISFVYLLVNVL